MNTKIIFIANTKRREDIESITKELIKSEFAIVPESMKILIKDREGFWSVVE